MKDKHVLAVFDPGLMHSLESSGVLSGIAPYIGHGVLDSSAPGVNVDSDAEHERLKKMLDSTRLITVGVTGNSKEEIRAIVAAEEKGVPCGIILRSENQWVWETLQHICSRYAFICCVQNVNGPQFSPRLSYPCELASCYNLVAGSSTFVTIIRLSYNLAHYGRDVPAIHERELAQEGHRSV